MAQQTAVEWLIEEIHKNTNWIPVHIQEQAKQMEKEQIENAFGAGNSTIYDWDDSSKKEYYNQTYGK